MASPSFCARPGCRFGRLAHVRGWRGACAEFVEPGSKEAFALRRRPVLTLVDTPPPEEGEPAMSEAVKPAPSPLALLRVAVSWAQVEGIHVDAVASPGVICVSRESRVPWRKDPMVGHVSPIGALVLLRQPRTTHVWAACAEVLGGSLPFSEGAQDGISKAPPCAEKFGGAAPLYLAGYEVGSRIRMDLMTVVCLGHGIRHPRDEKCPGCEEEQIEAAERD